MFCVIRDQRGGHGVSHETKTGSRNERALIVCRNNIAVSVPCWNDAGTGYRVGTGKFPICGSVLFEQLPRSDLSYFGHFFLQKALATYTAKAE